MINIKKLNPFGKFCVTMGMIPTSYKESLTYEEQLLWFCSFLDKEVIPSVNNNADAIIELQNYVANYFDNLDIQEEINNKLDEMAESGELADIIAQYLNLAGVLVFDTLDDMKNATNLANGSTAQTLGYANYLDCKGSLYKIREITNSDVIDNVNIVALNNSETLIAEKVPSQSDIMKKHNNIKPIFYANMYMGTGSIYETDQVKKHIKAWKKWGCKGVVPMINFNDDATLSVKDDLVKVKTLMDYAVANGLEINTMRFYCPMNNTLTTAKLDLYEAQIESVLETLNAESYGVERLCIFNELWNLYNQSATEEIKTKAVEVINTLKNLGYEVGIACSNLVLGIGRMINYSPAIANAVDYFGFNYYQGFPFKKEYTTYEDSVEAWSNAFDALVEYKIKYPNKDIILTETGCLNNWLNMMQPSNYRLNQYPANGKTYPIYYYGLLNNQLANTNLSEIWFFYDEVMADYDEMIDFFRYYIRGDN